MGAAPQVPESPAAAGRRRSSRVGDLLGRGGNLQRPLRAISVGRQVRPACGDPVRWSRDPQTPPTNDVVSLVSAGSATPVDPARGSRFTARTYLLPVKEFDGKHARLPNSPALSGRAQNLFRFVPIATTATFVSAVKLIPRPAMGDGFEQHRRATGWPVAARCMALAGGQRQVDRPSTETSGTWLETLPSTDLRGRSCDRQAHRKASRT